MDRIASHSLEQFCDRLDWCQPAPGGGAAIAATVAMAASLVSMAARFCTPGQPWATDLAVHGGELRGQALLLADQDGHAYQQVLEAQQRPREPDPAARRDRIATALHEATTIPTNLAAIGAEIADLAAQLAEQGNRNLAGDAITAALMAESATRAAAELVEINISSGQLDHELASQARQHAASAADAVQRCTSHRQPNTPNQSAATGR